MVVKFSGIWRYGTSGGTELFRVIPILESNWPCKNLMVAGNFNLTNADELNQKLTSVDSPVFDTDTQAILEKPVITWMRSTTSFLWMPREGILGEQHSSWIGERLICLLF